MSVDGGFDRECMARALELAERGLLSAPRQPRSISAFDLEITDYVDSE